MSVVTEQYSGVVIDQNLTPYDHQPFGIGVGLYPSLTTFPQSATIPSPGGSIAYYQTFPLPPDFARAGFIPDVTGGQFFVHVLPGSAALADLQVSFDQQIGINQWLPLATTTVVGTPVDGDQWVTAIFDQPVAISALDATYRLVAFSTAGIDRMYYSTSNALLTSGDAYRQDVPDDTLLPGALMFRLLAAVADSGVDFLGNVYRSALHTNAPSDGFWLSKPNPSQFAVESRYFDFGSPIVLDAITIDPITPGVNFHLYYSSDPSGPGTDPESWDHLLWTPVIKTFVAHRQDTYALPQPVVGRFLKIEFSRLQARSYSPGSFELPMRYQKHPKWVLDFFLQKLGEQDNDLTANRVNITYDLLDLAFSYYKDDVLHDPDPPALSRDRSVPDLSFNLQSQDLADTTTLGKIKALFQPYQTHPAAQADSTTLLGAQARSGALSSNYPVEVPQYAFGDTTLVSNLMREALLVEKGIEPMYFYLTCRHTYRLAQATFPSNVAYFAGVNSLTFHRHLYTQFVDFDQFNEVLADGQQLAFDYQTPPSLLPSPGT